MFSLLKKIFIKIMSQHQFNLVYFSEENRNSIINSSLESVISSSNVNSLLQSSNAVQPNKNSSESNAEVIKPNRPNSL